MRIYNNNGELIRFGLYDYTLEGETIPERVLKGIFNKGEFKNKRVIIHRDGPFRGDEKEVLIKIAESLEAEFYFVEIIKNNVPRMYDKLEEKMRPSKGSAFKLDNTQALLISSSSKLGTPRPLLIRTDEKLDIKKAIHSVLSMTLLHWGSLISPRLPVTIYYSDKIANMALNGIKPGKSEGNIPFWL